MRQEKKQLEMKNMSRVDAVFSHPDYIENLRKNEETERNREFCHHDMEHFLNVARLGYIFSMERGYEISKEEIYAAALLHDIGKWKQHQEGIPHEEASAVIAERILLDAGFSQAEKERILYAIQNHREPLWEQSEPKAEINAKSKEQPEIQLAQILYDADKMSRNCFLCHAQEQCDWSAEKKNQQILW